MKYAPDKNRIAAALETVISGEANIRALVGFDGSPEGKAAVRADRM